MLRRFARGEGKAGCVVWLLILSFVGLVAMRFIPAQVDKMKLEDYMEELAMMQSTARQPDDFFVKQIKRRAEEMRLPVKEEDIKVHKTSKSVVMEVKYTVVLDLLVTEYPMEMEIFIDRQIFLT